MDLGGYRTYGLCETIEGFAKRKILLPIGLAGEGCFLKNDV